MSKSYYESKPAAMVVTVIALSFVLPDSAVAETDTVARAISSARVEVQANQEINKREPGCPSAARSAPRARTRRTPRAARTPRVLSRAWLRDRTSKYGNSPGVWPEQNPEDKASSGWFILLLRPACHQGWSNRRNSRRRAGN